MIVLIAMMMTAAMMVVLMLMLLVVVMVLIAVIGLAMVGVLMIAVMVRAEAINNTRLIAAHRSGSQPIAADLRDNKILCSARVKRKKKTTPANRIRKFCTKIFVLAITEAGRSITACLKDTSG